MAALLAMLNSCSTGLSVVNIDNGFGAGYLASTINQLQVKVPMKNHEG
jgi:NCAIR mutase (PurE)-related protein